MYLDEFPTSCKRPFAADTELQDLGAKQNTKRRKLDTFSSESKNDQVTEWWDTLSRLWLTARALKEFERRANILSKPSVQEDTASSRLPPLRRSRRLHERRKAQFLTIVPSKQDAKRLKRFAMQGGPDLTHLRNISMSDHTSAEVLAQSGVSPRGRKRSNAKVNRSSAAGEKPNTRHSSAYDRDFEQKLRDVGVHITIKGRKPKNWADITRTLRERRRSLSPSKFTDDDFDDFQGRNDETRDEKDVERNVVPIILGKGDREHRSGHNVSFGNLNLLSRGTFTDAQPDIYYGADPVQLDKRIRENLEHLVVPSTNSSRPVLPNMFLEVKGPGGTNAVAKRQACYDGALSVRGIIALQSLDKEELSFDDTAYALSATYEGGSLVIFAHHATQNTTNKPEYHLSQVTAVNIAGSPSGFREGVAAYRNARDWTTEKRNNLIEAANKTCQSIPPTREPVFHLLDENPGTPSKGPAGRRSSGLHHQILPRVPEEVSSKRLKVDDGL